MIELSEIRRKPTEEDAEALFTVLKSALEALQKMVVAEAERLERDGLDTKGIEFSVEPELITVRIGDFMLFHQVQHWVSSSRR